MAVIGDITRAMICASPGHRLFSADYSGIEARVLAWLADEKSEIDQWAKFDRTGDPKDEPYYLTENAAGLSREQLAIWAASELIASSRRPIPQPTKESNAVNRRGGTPIRRRSASGATSTAPPYWPCATGARRAGSTSGYPSPGATTTSFGCGCRMGASLPIHSRTR
jgi:hypothetical protein